MTHILQSEAVQQALAHFLQHPARRFSQNLRFILFNFLMEGREHACTGDLLTDLEALYRLLDAIGCEQEKLKQQR